MSKDRTRYCVECVRLAAENARMLERMSDQEDGLRYGEKVCATLVSERDEAIKQFWRAWDRHSEKDRAYGEALRERDEARAEVERLRAEVESLRATAEREAASSPNGADRAEAAERALAYDAVLALFK